MDPLSLPLPGGTPVPSVGKRMKCSACGSRKVDTRPELYPVGSVAMRERWRYCSRKRNKAPVGWSGALLCRRAGDAMARVTPSTCAEAEPSQLMEH